MLVALAEADAVLLSSCCLLEATIVAQSRLGPEGQAELERLLDAFGVEISRSPPTRRQWQATPGGVSAKGVIPPLSTSSTAVRMRWRERRDVPLLAIGHDFARTDIELVELIG